ncbi:MAG: twin-arginine translocation pathway signal [Thiobacillus sp.]|nr:twin-arginine translocation pathway signal [Thiobacillus sp.]
MAAGASMVALTILTTTGCTTTSGNMGDPAAQRKAIDSAADSALDRLFKEVPGSQDLVKSAQGVLVFPTFVSAGFIVGGAHGRGVMREGGKSTGYFSMTEGSFGWLAGAQSQAVFILFMTEESLKRFQASNGWTAGVDGSVAILSAGANAQVSTQTAQQPVVGYVLTNAGLMANVSVNGSRITPLNI